MEKITPGAPGDLDRLQFQDDSPFLLRVFQHTPGSHTKTTLNQPTVYDEGILESFGGWEQMPGGMFQEYVGVSLGFLSFSEFPLEERP